MSSIRAPFPIVKVFLASILAFLAAVAPTPSQEVVLDVLEAEAARRGRDVFAIFGDQQDFFPVVTVEGVSGPGGAIRSNRDHAEWPDYRVSVPVDPSLRFYNATVVLREADEVTNETFDINPATGFVGYDFTFDACTLRWRDDSLAPFISFNPTGAKWLPFGDGEGGGGSGGPDKDARMRLRITTGDGKPFTTDDLALADATPVQATFSPQEIIEDKLTAFKVRIESTFTTKVTATVSVTLNDGVTSDMDDKTVDVPPEGLTVFLFDDTPFIPKKDNASNELTWSVNMTVPAETFDPDACQSQNNEMAGDKLPIRQTLDKKTVYRPFDAVYLGETPDVITRAELEAAFDASEPYRKAIFPLATLDSEFDATPVVNSVFFPINKIGPQLVSLSMSAASAGIEKMILVPRAGELADIGLEAPGVSLGEFAPRAVFVEHDTTMTAAHEIAHTFNVSRRNCSNGGLAETFFGAGCVDEYKHPSPPRPYVARGFDVEGNVHPSGFGGESGTREVIANNIMDTPIGGTSYGRWVDPFTFSTLTDAYAVQGDPELIGIWGWVEMPGGLQDPAVPFSGGLYHAYRYMGFPDLEEAPLNGQSGFGRFEIRILSQSGSYTYRFNPGYASDETTDTDERGFFGLSLHWPVQDFVTGVEIWGPADISDESMPANTLLAAISRSNADPVVTGLRAGLDATPTFAGPQPEPPTIGPSSKAVIAWQGSDSDSTDLRTILHVKPPFDAGSYSDWLPMAIDLDAGTFEIPQDWMQERPGTYDGRVLVTDGINTATYEQSNLFTICNYTNSGFEICNGVDDDCNGTIDDASPPGIGIQVSMSDSIVSWGPFPAAEAFDVVWGDVRDLLSTGGDFEPSMRGCLANGTTMSTVSFSTTPSAGEAYWTAVRGKNCAGIGSYDSGAVGQVGTRDAEIAAAPSACP